MKRLLIFAVVLGILPGTMIAEAEAPSLENPPLERPFIEVSNIPVTWESTQLAPPKPPTPPRPKVPASISRSPVGSRVFPRGQCTDLVARKTLVTWSGHAKSWPENARAAGRTTGSVPVVGAIGVTNESRAYGHVVYVEKVNDDGSFTFVESNYAGLGVITRRTMHPSDPRFITFIY